MNHSFFILFTTLICVSYGQAQIISPRARPVKCVMEDDLPLSGFDSTSGTATAYEKVLIHADVPCVHNIDFILETVGHRLNGLILGSAHLYPDDDDDTDNVGDRRRRKQRERKLRSCDPRCPGRINAYCTYFWCGNERRNLRFLAGNRNHTLHTIENHGDQEEQELRLLQTSAEILASTAQNELRTLSKTERDKQCKRFLKKAICSLD